MRHTKYHKLLGLSGCIVMLTLMGACGTQDDETAEGESIIAQEEIPQDADTPDADIQEPSGQDQAAGDGSTPEEDAGTPEGTGVAGEGQDIHKDADGTQEASTRETAEAGQENLYGKIKSTGEGSFVIGQYYSEELEGASILITSNDGSDPEVNEVNVVYTGDTVFQRLHILAADGSDWSQEEGTQEDLADGKEVSLLGHWEGDTFIADQVTVNFNHTLE